MAATLSSNEEAQLAQTIEMFEVITQSQPLDYQSLEILKEAYFKLNRTKDVVSTSKRIAQAYVQLGQLSSAILEYESILQRFPDDPDVQAALNEIENKANNFAPPRPAMEVEVPDKGAFPTLPSQKKELARTTPTEIDDGKSTMQKLFVESKLIAQADFNLYWITPNLRDIPKQAAEPFIQVLAEKQIFPLDKSLKLLTERSRLAYLPIDRYDVDIELAKTFPRDVCLRWSILPFDRMSKSVLVATSNPFNKQAQRDLEQSTKNRVLWYIAPPAELLKIIKKVYR